MKQLYINGRICDLNERDSPIAVTYQVNDLADVKDRKASTTNRFLIPLTANNRKIVGFPDNLGFVQMDPYRNLPAKLVQNGVEIITNGIAILSGAGADGIEVQVMNRIVDFFELIDGKKISELDLSEYDHTYDLNSVYLSQENTEGYKYPVIDYGGLPEDGIDVDVSMLRPAIFSKTVFDKIFSKSGFTYDGRFLNESRFKNELVPFSNDSFLHGESYDGSFNSSNATNTSSQFLSEDVQDRDMNFQQVISDPSGSFVNNWYTSAAVFKVRASINYSVEYYDIYFSGSPPTVTVKLQKFDGTTWADVEGAFITHTAWEYAAEYKDLDQVIQKEVVLNPGNQLRVWVHTGPSTDRIKAWVYQGATFKIEVLETDVVYGQSVQVAATLPDMSQKKFVKGVMQRYALVPVIDNHRKHINFRHYQELYENKLNAVDWTAKFVDKLPSVSFVLGDYARRNYGKYKEDENVPRDLGMGAIVVDNETLKEEKDIVVMDFSASVETERLNGLPMTSIKKIANPIESKDFTESTEARLLVDQVLNRGVRFVDGSGGNFLIGRVSVPYFRKNGRPGLGFDELFGDYYKELGLMLGKARKETREVMLNEMDIYLLDFFVPVYDAGNAGYYYLNKIEDYIEGEPATVELIRM